MSNGAQARGAYFTLGSDNGDSFCPTFLEGVRRPGSAGQFLAESNDIWNTISTKCAKVTNSQFTNWREECARIRDGA